MYLQRKTEEWKIKFLFHISINRETVDHEQVFQSREIRTRLKL